MPRVSRRVSESGYYHVVLRGNGKQVIFDVDVDRHAFLDALAKALETPGLLLHAWCIMSNHVHLLLSDAVGCLSSAMHDLATRYAGHFNSRSGHVGSVFDDRFKSVPVESDAQLLAAVRYIHDNPEKAGICSAADYPWSSYHEYVGEPSVTDVSVVLDLLGGVDGFVDMSGEERPTGYSFRGGTRVPDEDALDVARFVTFPADPRRIKELEASERGHALLAMREAGLTIKQVQRVTGIGRYAAERDILLVRDA